MSDRIENLARMLAGKHGGWVKWDTAASVCDTPAGNEPEEEREYWRAIARDAYAAGREDAAKVCYGKVAQADSDQPEATWALKDAAAAIRALPGKEGK